MFILTESWINKYLNQAEFIANNYSHDPSTKVGAVIVSKNNSILSQGWNGFARGVKGHEFRLNDRAIKYMLIVHAEANAIYNASREGISLLDSSIYLYALPPCSHCANAIVQSGIKNVYIRLKDDLDMKRWEESWGLSKLIFDEAGVDWRIV